MPRDIPDAIVLADYRAELVAELRRSGLTASEAIRLVRRETDSVECGIECTIPAGIIAASLLVLWEDYAQ